jgi:hypothetical protein
VLLRASPLALAVLALAACGHKSVHQKSLLPPGCSTDEVQAIVTGFLASPSFASFAGYRSQESDGRVFQTHSERAALAHLAARRRLGERDRLLQLQVFPVNINRVNIQFRLTRLAPDFRARRIYQRLASGSGSIDCAHGKVSAWSQKGP